MAPLYNPPPAPAVAATAPPWAPAVPVNAPVNGWVSGFATNLPSVTSNRSVAFYSCQALPYVPARSYTADQVAIEVTTAASAGGLMRLGLYASDAEGRLPGLALVDWGTVATDSTGIKVVTLGSPFAFVAGTLYWIASEPSVAACTVRAFDGVDGLYPRIPENQSEALSLIGRTGAEWDRAAGAFSGSWGSTGYGGVNIAVAFRRSA